MARNRQSQPRARNDRNNRPQSPKNKSIRRRGRNDEPQDIMQTSDRSGNRKGISSPGRRSAAREDDERNP